LAHGLPNPRERLTAQAAPLAELLILGRIMSDDFDVEGLFVKILAGALAATFLGGTLAGAVKILVML
jgi:hypothetical protein